MMTSDPADTIRASRTRARGDNVQSLLIPTRKRHPLDKSNGHEVNWTQVSPLFTAARRIPILTTAARAQADYVPAAENDLDFLDLERLVRRAHVDHDHIVQGRDIPRLLAAGPGYAITRPSRI